MKVTIGIPFFNPGQYFFDSIKSILLQTFSDFELILVDDGSTDNSLGIAHSFSDPRITIISDSCNLGLPSRLNQIVNLAKGKYIARMDADDLVALDRIYKQVEFLDKNPEIDLVSTGICSISNHDEVLSARLPTATDGKNLELHHGIKGATGIAHATILARRTWCLRNPYDESAKLMEDYQLWIDSLLRKDLKVGFIQEPLYFYREESSVQYKKVIEAYRNQRKVVNDKYTDKISLKVKLSFVATIKIKMLITYAFNAFGIMDKLITIRNRTTPQDERWNNFVCGEILKIKNFKGDL